MNVCFNAADFEDKNAGRIDAAAAQVMVGNGLDRWGQKRPALLGVLSDVKVDFRVEVSRHVFAGGRS